MSSDLLQSLLTPELDECIEAALERMRVPGMTFAIVHEHDTSTREMLPAKRMTTESLFQTADTTMGFTAAAVSMVIDDDRFSAEPLTWDERISSLIPDTFELPDRNATRSTTLEDALSHRSGLPAHWYAMDLARPAETLVEAVEKLRHLDLAHDPRTEFHYCAHIGQDLPIGKSGEVIPRESYAFYFFDQVHYDPTIYPDPNKWDPGRYLPDRAEDKKVPLSWLGFGAGGHVCTGMRFAKLQMNITIAHFVSKFDFSLCDGQGNPMACPPPSDRNKQKASRPDNPVQLRYSIRV
ncbi:hypothetical protein FE257_000013 [Aspergillus nanangensis]|uniref:Beta-lactamase-related domain-containing protein n=1 Tax=Aspergillus nanangensis TaxID=2582783 RepID=A0AAD4CYK8_ASPNN|nr:hypothetical protein FE257_000013 [Aspergillus nanangensis]